MKVLTLLIKKNYNPFLHKIMSLHLKYKRYILSKETVLVEQEQNFKSAVRRVSEAELDKMNLKYYNYEVHQASFVLPQFAAKV